MARIFTEGFEMGDALGFTVPTGMSATTSVKRSGAYSGEADMFSRNTYQAVSDLSEAFVRFGVYFATNGKFEVAFNNGDTQLVCIERGSGSEYRVQVGGTTVATGSLLLLAGVWNLVEMRVVINDTTGVIQTKINGIEDIDFSGDTKPDANTVFERIYFLTIYGLTASDAYYDDIAINDTTGAADNSWCGDGCVIAIKPNAAGDNTDLTNSDETQVNNYSYVD